MISEKKHTSAILIIFLTVLFSGSIKQSNAQGGYRRFFTEISAGTGLGPYFNNKFHTKKNGPGFSGWLTAREEIRFTSAASIMIGAELYTHALHFNSYYFADSTQFLYDGKMDYIYKIRINEVGFPVLFRADFFGKKKNETFQYLDLGAVPRIIFSSYLLVGNASGNTLSDKTTDLNFEYYMLSKKLSVYLQINYGIQFGGGDRMGLPFLEFNFKYAPVRFLFKEDFSANSLYINNLQFGVSFGIRI